MPRSNRPSRQRRTGGTGRGPGSRQEKDIDSGGLEHLMQGWRRTESRSSGEWIVQPISAARAVKDYRCPRCEGLITVGTAHVVVWRADGVLGETADLAARRHWHEHCWRLG